MVPNLIWAPDFFGPQEVWFLRNIGHEKIGPCTKIITWLFHAGPKLLGAQISPGPKFSGPKKVRRPNEIGDHFSYSLKLKLFKSFCIFKNPPKKGK